MPADELRLEILGPAKANLYLALANTNAVPWAVVRQLDALGMRVGADLPGLRPDPGRVRRLVDQSAGVIGDEPEALQAALEAGIPTCRLALRTELPQPELTEFCEAVLRAQTSRIPPYAFFIGRLERDFAHAREAIGVAVEGEAGIPCLWADDTRHRTNVESVRETTRLLIRHAALVIADLTLGAESPERENPSRAHEIGLSIAYGRRLMLTSQEPRRYPYFSIADMQMVFWDTEAELEQRVREWIQGQRESVAWRVLNRELAAAGHAPTLDTPTFTFDPARRYIGPKTRVARRTSTRSPAVAIGTGALLGVIALLLLAWG